MYVFAYTVFREEKEILFTPYSETLLHFDIVSMFKVRMQIQHTFLSSNSSKIYFQVATVRKASVLFYC